MNPRNLRTGGRGLLTVLLGPGGGAHQPTATAPALACTEASAMAPAHLYGTWQLTLWPSEGSASAPTSTGSVRFERHPEFPGSVRGHIQRTAAGVALQALVSGDVIDGEFNLDESADGVAIDAVWAGVPQDCGQSIRGTRRPAESQAQTMVPLQFLLRKSPGWH
jgi:hypothetical protein